MTTPSLLTDKLNRPYYQESVLSRRWLSCLKFGTFVFLFLLVFQPFGLSSFRGGIISTALGYGLTTFTVMVLLNILFFSWVPSLFSEEKWTVRREVYWNLINVIIIGLANALFSAYIGMITISPYAVLIFEFFTITLAVIPITITVLVKESRLKNKFEKRSKAINADIEKDRRNIHQQKNPVITIFSENGKENVELLLSELVFIQSSENYVEVYYLNKNSLQRKLLRNTLKSISSELEEYEDLFRCHKSYLVNISKVKRVSGNAQGYKLHLEEANIVIPVSRQNNEEIKKRFKH